MFQKHHSNGFTIVELLVVMALLGIIAFISASSFQNMYHASTLRAGGGEVYRALTSAHTQTLASKDDAVYGVHLSTSTVTRFTGGSYVSGAATNRVYVFEGGVTATSSLMSGTGDIVFSRLTGAPSVVGAISVRNTSGTTTINILASGLIEYD